MVRISLDGNFEEFPNSQAVVWNAFEPSCFWNLLKIKSYLKTPYEIGRNFFCIQRFRPLFCSIIIWFVTTFHRHPKRVFKCVSILYTAETMCVIKLLSSGSSYQCDQVQLMIQEKWVKRSVKPFFSCVKWFTYVNTYKFSTFQAFCTWNSFSHLPELKWTSVSRYLRSVKLIHWNR